MNLLRIQIVFVLVFVACRPAPVAVSPPEPAEVAVESDWILDDDGVSQIFGNAEGVRLVLVPAISRAAPSEARQYLLRATGTQSAYDGLVVVARREIRHKTLFWTAHVRGQNHTIVSHDEGKVQWNFLGYDFDDADAVVHLLDDSVDVDKIFKLRLKQANSGLRDLVPSKRADMELAQSARFVQEVSADGGSCGGISVSIDWSTVEDNWFREFSIASECSSPLFALRTICDHFPHITKRIADTVSVTCAFHGAPQDRPWKLEQQGGELRFSPGIGDDQVWEMWFQLIQSFGEDSQVLRLDDQHYIAKYMGDRLTFYNQVGSTFYPVTASSGNHKQIFLRPPRGAQDTAVSRRDGEWRLECGHSTQKLEVLVGAEREAVLQGAAFAKEPLWKREPYFLSRDSRGTYYYVDRYKGHFGGKRYRVFIGRKGQVRLSKLKGIVEDSEGTLFSTEDGQLRLIVDRGRRTAVWIHAKKKTELTSVSTKVNKKLIFDELGVYHGEELGLLCE